MMRWRCVPGEVALLLVAELLGGLGAVRAAVQQDRNSGWSRAGRRFSPSRSNTISGRAEIGAAEAGHDRLHDTELQGALAGDVGRPAIEIASCWPHSRGSMGSVMRSAAPVASASQPIAETMGFRTMAASTMTRMSAPVTRCQRPPDCGSSAGSR
jgi:hypothetical protein